MACDPIAARAAHILIATHGDAALAVALLRSEVAARGASTDTADHWQRVAALINQINADEKKMR